MQTCPVYCRFCTRSYAIGPDTAGVDKLALGKTPDAWGPVFAYIAAHPEIEDIVISGGDAYQLSPKNITLIGDALLDIPHVRRMRFATKGLAVMPMKILTDPAWVDALVGVVDRGRDDGQGSRAAHALQPPERDLGDHASGRRRCSSSAASTYATKPCSCAASTTTCDTMLLLVKRLEYINIHPYYVYMHDLVSGVEDLRTSVQTALDIEKAVRGATAGYNTPTFVCDAPGGGGKARRALVRMVRSRVRGFRSGPRPACGPAKYFLYFDPIDCLAPQAQARWARAELAEQMIEEAVRKAGAGNEELVVA